MNATPTPCCSPPRRRIVRVRIFIIWILINIVISYCTRCSGIRTDALNVSDAILARSYKITINYWGFFFFSCECRREKCKVLRSRSATRSWFSKQNYYWSYNNWALPVLFKRINYYYYYRCCFSPSPETAWVYRRKHNSVVRRHA